jgi:hypothetical protein
MVVPTNMSIGSIAPGETLTDQAESVLRQAPLSLATPS